MITTEMGQGRECVLQGMRPEKRVSTVLRSGFVGENSWYCGFKIDPTCFREVYFSLSLLQFCAL